MSVLPKMELAPHQMEGLKFYSRLVGQAQRMKLRNVVLTECL